MDMQSTKNQQRLTITIRECKDQEEIENTYPLCVSCDPILGEKITLQKLSL